MWSTLEQAATYDRRLPQLGCGVRAAGERTLAHASATIEGRSLSEIARELNADAVLPSQGGRQWWPSTVRAVLARSSTAV
jgi:hypothetical protein